MLVSGLAKINKIMSMFVNVLFSRLFGHFGCLTFLKKMGDKLYTKVVIQDIFSQFFKSTTKVTIFSKKPGYLD